MRARAVTRCIAFVLAGVPVAAWCQSEVEAVASKPVELEPWRLERVDSAGVASRSPAGYRTDMTEIRVQRWAHSGRAAVGLGVGSLGLVDRPIGPIDPTRLDGGSRPLATASTLMLGLRYRASDSSSFYADATHVRGSLASDERVVSKVGLEFKAAQSDWKIAYGGLGFRLAGDTRMTLKVKRSGLSVMMRRAF